VSICNRTAAGQPVLESLCPLWAPFRPGDDDESKNPTSVGGSRWVSMREIRLGSDIRSGRIDVDAVETVTKRVKVIEKTIRRTSVSSGTTSEKPIYPGSRGGWTNPNFNRWVNRSSGSWT
jgi:hypothetical protein